MTCRQIEMLLPWNLLSGLRLTALHGGFPHGTRGSVITARTNMAPTVRMGQCRHRRLDAGGGTRRNSSNGPLSSLCTARIFQMERIWLAFCLLMPDFRHLRERYSARNVYFTRWLNRSWPQMVLSPAALRPPQKHPASGEAGASGQIACTPTGRPHQDRLS
jgi:hypothetical protein